MKTKTMNKTRLKKIESLPLAKGQHKSLSDGACVMEMVSYLANEPWSDHPKCACPILTTYAIAINDRFNDGHRQLLKPLILLLVDTKSTDEVQIARKRLMRWRNVTVTFPLILDAFKMTEHATVLRGFKNTLDDMAKASAYLSKHREAMRAYAYANANAYAYANAYANAYAYADAYADANAYADADAYADAYAYAYADAYAYANAFRQKVAETAIETLKMAIEVKDEN